MIDQLITLKIDVVVDFFYILDLQIYHRADHFHKHFHSGNVPDLYPDPVPCQGSHQPEVQVQAESSNSY